MKATLLLVLLFPAITGQVQEPIKRISGGLKLGGGISMLNHRPAIQPGYKVRTNPIQVLLIGGRVTFLMKNNLLLMTECCFGGKGGAYTVSSGDSIYYLGSNKVKSVTNVGTFLFNLCYRTCTKTNTFFFGAGPAIDFYSRYTERRKTAAGLNILTGYRFFPGFSAEFSCKRDLFRYNRDDIYNTQSFPCTVTTISLAYDF